MHQCAKFSRNRSNRGRDIAIFRFFMMAAAAILDFQNMKFLTFATDKRVELRNHTKFCQNRLNRGRDMVIFRFFKRILKYFHCSNKATTGYVYTPAK